MNDTRVALGIAAWFLGILIPVLHHSLLHLGVAGVGTSNIITRSRALFRHLPWIDWVYLVAMAVVGAVLVLSGIREK